MSLDRRHTLRYFAEELVGLKLEPGQERLVDLLDESFDRLQTVVVRKGRRSGMTAVAVVDETADSVTLVGGCVIQTLPCSARSSRGRPNRRRDPR